MFSELSVYYRDELERSQKRFMTVFEPFLVILSGALIAAVVVAIFIPLVEVVGTSGM